MSCSRSHRRSERRRRRAVAIAFAIAVAPALVTTTPDVRVASPTFFADDPIHRVPETQDASGVQEFEHGLVYDILLHSFAKPGDQATDVRAANVNTIDEVPDSSWFTDRIIPSRASGSTRGSGAPALTAADVARGPDTTDGPAPGRWTITRSKSAGLTPGFTIRDERQVVWFLKFDPLGSPELASGAEVVSTKLFHALGYFVPENRIASFRREQLVIGQKATIKIGGGPARRVTEGDVDRLLRRVARSADGSYRVLASRAVEGRPVGAFKYYGTRPDDPNDVVPHEHRRELRGLRVFAAWTQHVDTKGGNSLDTVVEAHGKRRVRHHLIDLGSTLGSAGVRPREYNEGHELLVSPGQLGRGVLGFGFPVRPWRTIPYPDLPSIGRFEGEHFDPDAWVPSIPNPAFLRARPEDLFWGARRVMAFTDDMIRAAVHTGGYSAPAAEQHLAQALIARRDRIGRAWLPIVNPIVDPVLDDDGGGTLRFVNAAVAAKVAAAPRGGYRAAWYAFDNATGESTSIGESQGENGLKAPDTLPRDAQTHVRVDVQAIDPPDPSWTTPVKLFFRREASGWTLVGLAR